MTLEQRIESLERERRLARLVGGVLGVMVIVLAVLVVARAGQRIVTPAEIEVRSLRLKDDAGRTRLEAGVHRHPEDGEIAYVSMLDGAGRDCVTAEVYEQGDNMISLGGSIDNPRIMLTCGLDSGPMIHLVDRRDRSALELSVGADNEPRIRVFSPGGGLIWEAPDDDIREHALRQDASCKCAEYYAALTQWKRQGKGPPTNLAELDAPSAEGQAKRTEIHDDPWGHPYVLRGEGDRQQVASCGPDGQPGTDDDIVFPPEEFLPREK